MPTVHPTASPTAAGVPAHPSVGAATSLLDAYRPGQRFLATPTRTLLAEGVHAEVPDDGRPLPERVRSAVARAAGSGHVRPLVMGSIPFAPDAPAALVVPQSVSEGPPLVADPLIALPPEPASGARWTVTPVPAPEAYGKGVEDAVRRMRAGEFDKVVLARSLELASDAPLDLPAMLQRLARRDPGAYNFALPTGDGRTLVGASPELLVSRRGERLVANPLAGSTPRSADLAEDVSRAAALLRSAKDLHEHAVVVDAMRRALAPYTTDLVVPERPTLIRTATMWHLSTTITATVARPDLTALELAAALHPTPAVCGTPTDVARRVIGETEQFDRGFFTGMVGWQDAAGDGEWIVTIRCAEAEEAGGPGGGGRLRLYAGAGIVADSRPEEETAETAAKFRTFLQAVGVAL
ncbi:isochorismate synthase [Streptomyces sp. NPDC057939]|uniref:isochorismate synthase n=1 Tax=Streptomyces sp. NPDC057939 TaxID=3346284 RepID=UPI0036E5507E